jgi:hypothetical protein
MELKRKPDKVFPIFLGALLALFTVEGIIILAMIVHAMFTVFMDISKENRLTIFITLWGVCTCIWIITLWRFELKSSE